MIHFVFSDKDTRYLFLKFDNNNDLKNLRLLKGQMNLINPLCYLPTYTGPKYTEDFLFEHITKDGTKVFYCAIGLWQVVYNFFKENNIEYDGLDSKWFKRELNHTFDEFKEIVDSWGLKYKPRDYQYEAAYKILQWKQSLSQLATRAGKTLTSYIIFRYAIEYLNVKKILMIVPSISLVKQGYDDFKEYAEFFNTECVWGGGKLVESANLTIGTFQSLIKFIEKPKRGKTNAKYNPDFFNDYDLVCVDETHRATAAQITNIISQPFMKNVKIAFGMTGTLPKEHTIERYCLHALLGAKIQAITPHELQEAGHISDIHIIQHHLTYINKEKIDDIYIKCAEYALSEFVEIKDEKTGKKKKVQLEKPEFLIVNEKSLPYGIQQVKSLVSDKEKYIAFLKRQVTDSTATNALHIEQMMLHFFDERIDYLITDIINKCQYNTLLLAQHTNYLDYVYNRIKEKCPDKIVLYISGRTGSKQREEIKQILKDNNNCILCASYGTMSTGITLANLCHGILFESFKSDVINMQSIGRGLGLSDLKDKYILHDFVDILPTKKIYVHGRERRKIYDNDENQYEYEIIKKNIL